MLWVSIFHRLLCTNLAILGKKRHVTIIFIQSTETCASCERDAPHRQWSRAAHRWRRRRRRWPLPFWRKLLAPGCSKSLQSQQVTSDAASRIRRIRRSKSHQTHHLAAGSVDDGLVASVALVGEPGHSHQKANLEVLNVNITHDASRRKGGMQCIQSVSDAAQGVALRLPLEVGLGIRDDGAVRKRLRSLSR